MRIAIIYAKALQGPLAESMVADLRWGLRRQFVPVSGGIAMLVDMDEKNLSRLKARSDAFSAFLYGDQPNSKSFDVCVAVPA